MKSKTETVTLKDMSTKELLNALYGSYGAYNYHRRYEQRVGSRTVAGGKEVSVSATHDEIKSELALRPHLPSKREGSENRRLKAKAGK